MSAGEQRSGGVPAARKPSRQRRQPGGRKNVAFVRLSVEEKAALEARAERLGVSVPRLLVESALAGNVQTLTERRALIAELLAVRRLLAALSNNVNQLARIANATGQVPAEFGATTAAVARAAARLDAVVAELNGGRR